MPVFSPEQLAGWTDGRWTARPTGPLTSFHFDSRRLEAGAVFVAVRSEQRDGHDFLAAARTAGAGAALVSIAQPQVDLPQLVVRDPLAAWQVVAREHRRAFGGPVVGISGSAGKTSTKDLLAALLGGASCGVVATEGNLNNHLGVPMTLTRLDPARHRFAVIEAGVNAPGEMSPLAEMIAPDVALITLVAAAHTAALGGLEGVAREKATLPAAVRPAGVAIFTRETANYPAFQALGGRRLIVEPADVTRPAPPPAEGVRCAISHSADATTVTLAYGPPPPHHFTLRRVSAGMAQNAALALVAALWLGVSPESIQARLHTWQPAALRGEIREIDGRLLYLDCYNANPASMADALEAFAALAPAGEPRLYLLGCMEELGADAARHHRALGQSLRLRAADRVVVVGTWATDVAAGLAEGGFGLSQVEVAESLAPATAALAAWRGTVFVKGSRKYALERVLAGVGREVSHA